jgi:hypothetical protein
MTVTVEEPSKTNVAVDPTSPVRLKPNLMAWDSEDVYKYVLTFNWPENLRNEFLQNIRENNINGNCVRWFESVYWNI